MKKKEIFNELSLEEKAQLFVGKNTWELEKINNRSLFLSDGPHGIRKEYVEGKKTKTVKAICYPTASLTAASFNKDLLYDLGSHLASECIHNNIDVLLGPGINIKRDPRCGRSFEYFSEDPYLSGRLAASYIKGVEAKNVGVSLKHFAANSQEEARFINDSIVDERALREIYLKGFEIAIKEANPSTIMVSYNKLNGVRTCNNSKLLTEIGRNEFGFKGAYISDWGAIDNSLASIKAGLDLEMPGNSKGSEKRILEAIKDGSLDEEVLNNSTKRLIDLSLKCNEPKVDDFNEEEALDFATRVNEEAIVLLKNEDNILPLNKEDNILLVGDFVKNPRYQGGGSSQINPIYLTNLYDELKKENISFSYAKGYNEDAIKPSSKLIKEAVEKSRNADKVIIMIGLPRIIESEGYDRDDLKMPESHLALVREIARVNKNIIVILQNGSPVEIPFINNIKGLIEAYLGGSMHAKALVNILYGRVNPSGRLAESFPLHYEDSISSKYYLKNPYYAMYKEGIYVGYRYYETFNKPVLFPFGYGLSYSEVEYSDFIGSLNNDEIIFTFKLKNKSNRPTKEVVELYAGLPNSIMYRAKKELKEFIKVELKPNEEKKCSLSIKLDSLRYWDIDSKKYLLEQGKYRFYLAKNANDEALYLDLEIESNDLVKRYPLDIYYKMDREITDSEFEEALGYKMKLGHRLRPFTADSPIKDFYHTILGFILFKPMAFFLVLSLDNKYDKKMYKKSIPYQPIRSLQMASGITKDQIDGIVDIFNFHYIKGFKKLFKK